MKILIADDHALFREGMRHVLAQLDADVEVLEAASCDQVLERVPAHPDLALVLMDIDMPARSGLSGLTQLASQHPLVPVVILSASQQRAHIRQALEDGAAGFIPKTATATVMLNALRLVLGGGVYVPPEIIAGNGETRDPPPADQRGRLTPRQLEVLSLITEGHPNKVIARKLELSEATVKAHITAIMRVLGVSNRTQAVCAARTLGLVGAEI